MPDHGDTFERIAFLLTVELADLYTPEEARQWIFAPQPLLGGSTPASLILAGRVGEVMQLINQIRDGVYT